MLERGIGLDVHWCLGYWSALSRLRGKCRSPERYAEASAGASLASSDRAIQLAAGAALNVVGIRGPDLLQPDAI
jgi:hypothetical protein